MNTEALAAFSTKRAPGKAAWRPPEITDFQYRWARTVMAFDPSLRGCGAVCVTLCGRQGHADAPPRLWVDAAKKFSTSDHEVGGYEESLRKTLELAGMLRPWILETLRGHAVANVEFVHEGPPVGGGKVIRPEASLLGGAALRFALTQGPPLNRTVEPMIQPQTHKRLWCGPRPKNQTITKKEHHDAMMARAREWDVIGLDKITNEATRDAFSVGCMQLTRPQEIR